MDDRQSKIQIGAGLQESRLNTDLIQWLEKYSSWILGVLLVVVAAYFGWSRYTEARAKWIDEAFVAYTAARGEMGGDGVLLGSPDNLLQAAREHDGMGSVWSLASLDAASIYLGSARRALRPGTDLTDPKPEDFLSPEQTNEMARSADRIFAEVAARHKGNRSKTPLYLRALLGVASTALSLGEIERAREALEEIVQVAEREGFGSQAEEANRRIEQLAALAESPRLYSEAELPAPPSLAPLPPEPSLQSPVTLIPMPEGWSPPGIDPETQLPIVPTPPPEDSDAEPQEEPAPGN